LITGFGVCCVWAETSDVGGGVLGTVISESGVVLGVSAGADFGVSLISGGSS
jgi:hypothetical protein